MARPKSAGAGRDRPWKARDVVELAVQHDLAELEVEEAGLRVRVVRERAPGTAPVGARTAAAAALTQAEVPAQAASGLLTVEAPMVGTFYRASGPEAAPFVAEGDLVKEGAVLCIIEAMKLMNEIETKVAGRIAKVLVENAQPVEYGQPLFQIEPRR